MSDHRGHWAVRRGTAADLASLLPLVREFCAVDGHGYDELYDRDRGRGAGAALLEAILAAARAGGASRMFLETEDGNIAARRFYARAGFDVEGSVWMQRPL